MSSVDSILTRPGFGGGFDSTERWDYANIKGIKGHSSRLLRQEFPHLKSRIPTLWTNNYFVATVGGATLAIVKQYVANQRNV